jgi:hypothetical protein
VTLLEDGHQGRLELDLRTVTPRAPSVTQQGRLAGGSALAARATYTHGQGHSQGHTENNTQESTVKSVLTAVCLKRPVLFLALCSTLPFKTI